MTTILSKGSPKVLVPIEIVTVIALLVITLLYDPLVFGVVIAPAMTGGIIANRRIVLYLVFDHWPSMFSK